MKLPRPLRSVPRWLLVLVGLACFGLARAPYEERARETLVEAHLLLPPLTEDAVQHLSQSTLMGALGGLRALVSTYLSLKAFDHFTYKEWEDLRRTYRVVTSLEPRDENHWRDAVWHLGINATANMEIDESLPLFERRRRFDDYALSAVAFAEEGIAQNPESSAIRQQLAEVYREKLRDDCAAARVYGEMIGLPGTLTFIRRFHGYFMARCPGMEEEAYRYLLDLYYEGEHHHLPTLIVEIKILEAKLGIPLPQRIRTPDPELPPSDLKQRLIDARAQSQSQ